MRSKSVQYQSVDELYTQKDSVTSYWKLISHLSLWMLLGGFLILPTTFDKDPQLRFSSGVVTIVIVAFLTGGYSLSALLWFACPSVLFRLESIYIPGASASFFGFLSAAWALTRSSRFDATQVGCPVTIVLTLVSTAVFGILAFLASRQIRQSTQKSTWPVSGVWQDGGSGYYDPYSASTYPLTAPSEGALSHTPSYAPVSAQNYVPTAAQSYELNTSQSYAPNPAQHLEQNTAQSYTPSFKPLVRAPTEEDMIGRQMARLLTKSDRGTSPNANQQTFQLKWPPGEEDEESDTGKRNRARTLSVGALHLSPGDAMRHGRKRSESGSALSQLGQAMGLDKRGRAAKKEQKEKEERRRSRDERRREIELGAVSQSPE